MIGGATLAAPDRQAIPAPQRARFLAAAWARGTLQAPPRAARRRGRMGAVPKNIQGSQASLLVGARSPHRTLHSLGFALSSGMIGQARPTPLRADC